MYLWKFNFHNISKALNSAYSILKNVESWYRNGTLTAKVWKENANCAYDSKLFGIRFPYYEVIVLVIISLILMDLLLLLLVLCFT